jgi:hypothetical protein
VATWNRILYAKVGQTCIKLRLCGGSHGNIEAEHLSMGLRADMERHRSIFFKSTLLLDCVTDCVPVGLAC